jgi:drug/metabolite transporter (DMT)-like permease
MLVAIVAALAAAAAFAGAGILQQRMARARPRDESLSPTLLVRLAQDRTWLTGIGLAFLAYALQSVALAFGPLALVQPLLVAEVVFALPISVRLHHMSLGRREWAGAAAVVIGLATAIVAGHPRGDPVAAGLLEWGGVVAAAAVLTALAVSIARRIRGPVRASVLAVSAGVAMGTQSGLLAETVRAFRMEGVVAVFAQWQTYALVVVSIGGLLLIQSAYQAGPLAASMPVMDTTEPVVAVWIGLLLFEERIADGLLRQGLAVLGLVVVAAGIVLLDTSPTIQRLHERNRPKEEEADDPAA